MPDTRDEISPQNINRLSYQKFKIPHDLNVTYSTYIRFVRSERSNPASPATEKLTGGISLPLPNNIPEAYNIGYNNPALGNIINELKELFITGGGAENISNIAKDAYEAYQAGSLQRFTQSLEANGGQLGNTLRSRLGSAAGSGSALDIARAFQAFVPAGFQDTAAGSAIAQQLGSIPNPHMTTVFAGLGPRTGELRWKISPRSKHESRQLNEMIRFIRKRIHPEVTPNGLSLLFPDEVYIDFYPAEFLIPYKKSVVTNLVINNTPSGRPVFYEGGAPVEMDLVMTVQEVTPRTRDDF